MAYKHPKHRRIPRTLLKIKALRHLENKVIGGLHVLEFVVILLVAAGAVTTAFFLNLFGMHDAKTLNDSPQPIMEKQLENKETTDTTVKETKSVNTKDTTNEKDKKDKKNERERQPGPVDPT